MCLAATTNGDRWVSVMAIDELGMIRATPRPAASEQENNELTEAIDLGLSAMPFRKECPCVDVDSLEPQRANPRRAPPPLPPADSRHAPPTSRPPTKARDVRVDANRLPSMFSPLGAQWGNSPLARAFRLPSALRRWPPVKERFAYFPTHGRGYGPRRRILPGRAAVAPTDDPHTETDETDRDDAPSAVSAAPTCHLPDLPGPL